MQWITYKYGALNREFIGRLLIPFNYFQLRFHTISFQAPFKFYSIADWIKIEWDKKNEKKPMSWLNIAFIFDRKSTL